MLASFVYVLTSFVANSSFCELGSPEPNLLLFFFAASLLFDHRLCLLFSLLIDKIIANDKNCIHSDNLNDCSMINGSK